MHAVLRSLPILVIAMAVAFSLTASAAPNPINIQQCFVTVPKAMSHKASGIQITYVNQSHKPVSKVSFAVSYRNSEGSFKRRIDDVGDFAPGAVVDHHFDTFNDITYGGKKVESCQAIAVVFGDGTTWRK
jgi:hypothetical protein